MGSPDSVGQNQSGKKLPILGWRFFVGCAQAARNCGDIDAAEKHYIEALAFVEKTGGAAGLTSAVVMLELAEFYEDHGKSDCASSVWARVRDLLGKSLGEISAPSVFTAAPGSI